MGRLIHWAYRNLSRIIASVLLFACLSVASILIMGNPVYGVVAWFAIVFILTNMIITFLGNR